jgi:hypothetical protein
MLDAADVYVLLKLLAPQREPWVQNRLAVDIGVSPSVVNRALKKAASLKLYHPAEKRVSIRPLHEALVTGARFFLAPQRGGETRGCPTAWAAPPLANSIVSTERLPPVWPFPDGETRGLAVEPLHPSAPQAARRDADFYELLALTDVLRIGGPRERALAERELRSRVERHAEKAQ